MNPRRFTKPILAFLALVFLTGAGLLQRSMEAQRQTLGLNQTAADLKGAPPMLAFTTVALGGFRGLISNVLWIRANQLQEEDKFFEMVQLADWITKLQPRLKQVWFHQAWNMAYNISVKFSDPEDRWRWVQRGIELLRDEGLKYNPDEPLLYRELAWLFQHKLGANLDDAHMLYKQRWMEAMTAVLGAQRDSYLALVEPKTDDARERRKTLKEKHKMDPAVMRDIDQKYGPLEWRLPEAHAVYWGYVGMTRCKNAADLMPLRRVMYQNMQLAFQRGRLVPNRAGQPPMLGPNLDIIPQVSASYEQEMRQEKEGLGNIKNGHKNFLRQAVFHLYTHARIKEANFWFDYLKKNYPDDNAVKNANGDMETFALSKVAEGLNETDVNKTISFIEGYISTAYLNLALDYDDRADGFLLMARKLWISYQERMGARANQRVGLPEYALLESKVLNALLDPERGLQPELQAIIRAKRGLPPPQKTPPGNSQPPSSPAPAPQAQTPR